MLSTIGLSLMVWSLIPVSCVTFTDWSELGFAARSALCPVLVPIIEWIWFKCEICSVTRKAIRKELLSILPTYFFEKVFGEQISMSSLARVRCGHHGGIAAHLLFAFLLHSWLFAVNFTVTYSPTDEFTIIHCANWATVETACGNAALWVMIRGIPLKNTPSDKNTPPPNSYTKWDILVGTRYWSEIFKVRYWWYSWYKILKWDVQSEIFLVQDISSETLKWDIQSEIFKSEILRSKILTSEIFKSEILRSEILESEIFKSEILTSEIFQTEVRYSKVRYWEVRHIGKGLSE